MNTLDFWLLVTLKTLGGVAVSLFFIACIHELVWFIYRNLVGWPVILEALKDYRSKQKEAPKNRVVACADKLKVLPDALANRSNERR